jgi:hypothetical protein
LRHRRRSGGVAGFARMEEQGAPGHGLISGAPGLGLALLATVSEVPPDWDRALLLSIR